MSSSSAPRPGTCAHPPGTSPRRPGRPLLLVGLLVGPLLVSACGTVSSGALTVSAKAPTTVTGAAPTPTGAAAPPAAAGPTPAAGVAPAADDRVVALRRDLQRLLGAHVLRADEVVRATLLKQDGAAAASSASVASYTDQLVQVIGSLAGPAAAAQFRTSWDRHVEVLGQYATALRDQQPAARLAARKAYDEAEQDIVTTLSAVVGGKVPPGDLTAGVTAHGEHLLGQADAYATKDYARAFAMQREGFAHMIAVGDVLARGIAASKGLSTAELDSPRRDLDSAMTQLLAEHMGLTVQALRSARDDAADFAATGVALNGNTADLGAAVGTLFGAEAGKQFLALWADHVEGLVQVARAADDPAAARAGRQAQTDYAPRLARFLAGATEERLPAIDLAAALTVHDDHLLEMADAYAAQDFQESQQQSDAGYDHMVGLASTLALAIGDTKAAALPNGGAATGGGGTVAVSAW